MKAKGDTKELYRNITGLTGSTSKNKLPECDNDDDVANSFADFFIEKMNKIREKLDDYPVSKPPVKEVNTGLSFFRPMSEIEIRTIIFDMKMKTCETDLISTKFLKYYINDFIGFHKNSKPISCKWFIQ